MHSIGIKKIGGMALVLSVLSFVAMACVAGQPGAQLNDPTGVDPGGQNTIVEGGKGLQQADPEPVEPKCPPKSLTYTNGSSGAVNVSYVCEGGSGGITTVPAGGSVTFKESCGIGEDVEPDCISCEVTRWRDSNGIEWSCDLQNAYATAYGIDLAVIGYTSTDADSELPRKIYDVDGNLIRLSYFTIPVIDENGEFVEWELTTIKPNFSVEDGEVVIRDKFMRVIGNRTGITLGE